MIKQKSDQGRIRELLARLKNRDERMSSFIELAKIAAPDTIKTLLDAIKKMTWEDALNVAEYLSNFGNRIIPYLKSLVKPPETKVYTFAIKALGYTQSDDAFKFIFPLLVKEEKWILSNDRTFGETVEAITRCGKGSLKELLQLLDRKNWKLRLAGVYACGRIAVETEDIKVVDKLKKHLRLLAAGDRSEKVREMAKFAISWIIKESDIIDSYIEAIEFISSGMVDETLYSRYNNELKIIFNGLGYNVIPKRDENGYLNIENLPLPVGLSLNRTIVTGEGYLTILVPICELPDKNILAFYRRLLELNEFLSTGTAKFFTTDNLIFMQDVRKLDSINVDEVVSAIVSLANRAKELREELTNEFTVFG